MIYLFVSGLLNKSHVELPFYSKYLLIAAYLASYNPAKSDRKFFAKHSGKGSRKSQQIKKSERVGCLLYLKVKILGYRHRGQGVRVDDF
jgi:origin recognition complex subunit 5